MSWTHFLSADLAEAERFLLCLILPLWILLNLFRRFRFIFKISVATSSKRRSNYDWASEYDSKSSFLSLIRRDLSLIFFSRDDIWSSKFSFWALGLPDFFDPFLDVELFSLLALESFLFLTYLGLGSLFLVSIYEVRSDSSFS